MSDHKQSVPHSEKEDVDKEFEEWKIKYEKSYSSPEEEAKRKKMWLETRTRVIEHNKRADAGEESYWMAVNHFADRHPEEVCGCFRKQAKGCCHDEKMKAVLLFLLVCVVALCVTSRPVSKKKSDVDGEFEEWKLKYEKSYSSPEEEARRKQQWLKSRAMVIEHNKKADAGEETYWMAVNHFADRLPHEFGSCLG
ncbi:salarin-like [Scleropages formosus]|uniref:Salarin-like n=2 Tax=Scleropages formosus TaxID=113540 RepID=A0A0N8JVI1_SCLFO|nr:salarin-like [Scleropages formosus]